MCEGLELVNLRALLALHIFLVLLDLTLLGRGHGKDRLGCQSGSEEESLELHFCAVWGGFLIYKKKNLMRWRCKGQRGRIALGVAVGWREEESILTRILPSLLYFTEFGIVYKLNDTINTEMTLFRENTAVFADLVLRLVMETHSLD